MKTPEPVVLSTSDDAAKIVTVTGWVDRQGRFWGNDENLRLLICEANYPREIDGSDHFSDDLPEDGELPSVLEAAFEALNEVIKKQPPLSWSPRKMRPTIESLPVLERA